MGRVTIVDTQHAWGYHSPEDFPAASDKPLFRKCIYAHDICNAASIFLSPIIGLIRGVVAIFLLIKFNKDDANPGIDSEATRRFAWMQLGRAGLELLCLGPILGTILDGIMTLKNKKLLCFKQNEITA
jgi:hypothetical protein